MGYKFIKTRFHWMQYLGIKSCSQANTWAQRAQNVIASYVVGGVVAELGGAPIGIEGPSIHIGGSIFYGFNRFIKLKRKFLIQRESVAAMSCGMPLPCTK
jgi:H+/Cl- antiporter ClcA